LLDHNSTDASELAVAFGTGGEKAIEALLAAANKLSACVIEVDKKDW